MFDSYKDIFEKRGATYHEAMQTWPRARDQEFEAIVSRANIAPGEIVCDMPSGGGYLRNYLAKDQHLISIETSASFFAALPDSDVDEKYLCELDETPVQTGTVDVALSLAGLHHLEDKSATFREMYRILRPKGRAVVADVAAGSITASFLNVFVHENNQMGHEGIFLDETTRRNIRAAGFDIIADETVNYHWCFKNAADMSRYAELLFGIDLADHDKISAGIAEHLGTEAVGDQTGMNWTLDFISCVKS